MSSGVSLAAELRAASEPWESLGAWPRAGEDELRRALESLAAGAARWSAQSAEARQLALARWMRQAVQGAAEQRSLGRRIGFDAELDWGGAPELESLARDLDRELERPRTARGPLALVVCDWSELAAGLLRSVGSALQAGRAVLVLSDARTPMCADQVHAALLGAGLPADLLAVLHGVDAAGLEFLAGDGRLGDLLISSASPQRVWAWRAFAERAGLAAAELRLLRAGSLWVAHGDDLQRAAKRVARAAFDPRSTLFGQAPGQVGRVHCARRSFSAFSEALLLELDASGLGQAALALIDLDSREAFVRRWNSALDQGATLIAGGELPGGRTGPRELRVPATVLTNVEAHMLCARSDFPLPVLCLLRADEEKLSSQTGFQIA